MLSSLCFIKGLIYIILLAISENKLACGDFIPKYLNSICACENDTSKVLFILHISLYLTEHFRAFSLLVAIPVIKANTTFSPFSNVTFSLKLIMGSNTTPVEFVNCSFSKLIGLLLFLPLPIKLILAVSYSILLLPSILSTTV